MSIELSFRPRFDFTVSTIADVADVDATAYLDVPKLDVEVSQVHDVTSSCDPASSNLPANQVYQNLTKVVPSIGFDAAVILWASEDFIGKQSSPPFLLDWTAKNLSTSCLSYNAAAQTLGPATQVKASGSKTGAAKINHAHSAGALVASFIVALVTF